MQSEMSTLQSPVLNMSTNVKKFSRLDRENNNVFQKIERPCHLYNTKIPQELQMKLWGEKRLFHNTPGSWQNSFLLTSRELYRIIFCLKVLLIFLCVYLLTKITLRDICHKLSKQPSEFTLNWFAYRVARNFCGSLFLPIGDFFVFSGN